MFEPIIYESKVIIRSPEIRVCGVVCKDNKMVKQYKSFGSIAVICGVVGVLGLISILSYYNVFGYIQLFN